MRKYFIIPTLVVAFGILGFTIHQEFVMNDSYSNLTPTQIENIEALGDIEGWIELGYADNCDYDDYDVCVRTPTEVHFDLKPIYKN